MNTDSNSAALREGGSLNVLVAEDNKVNQKVIKFMLDRLGHENHIVNDGSEAVKALEVSTFDLILMDIDMPVMDGFEATLAIRASKTVTNPNILIVALTANAMGGDKEQCLSQNMNGYLAKPISLGSLKDILEEMSSGKSNK